MWLEVLPNAAKRPSGSLDDLVLMMRCLRILGLASRVKGSSSPLVVQTGSSL